MVNFLKKYEYIIILAIFYLLLRATLFANFVLVSENEFSELAWSFIHGQTHFLNTELVNMDILHFQGQTYWHMPPLPALLLMPLVFIFQQPISQNLLTFLTNFCLGFLLFFFIKKRFNFSSVDSSWLVILYLFASIYISSTLIIGPYWYAQTIVTILLILALYEFFGKKRFWLIGLLLGLVMLTRYTAVLNFFFFALFISLAKEYSLKDKIKQLLYLGLPIVGAIIIILLYNQLRFNTPLANTYQMINPYTDNAEIHQHGFFSPYYIPTNFYYYFLESWSPYYADPLNAPSSYHLRFPYLANNIFGSISFFLVSPLFILLFKSDWKNKLVLYALITSLLITLVLLSYYYNGFQQIGPRYLNDALPMFFICLLFYLQKTGLNYKHKLIIIFSSAINIYIWYVNLFYNWVAPIIK